MTELSIATTAHTQMIDLTRQLQEAVTASGLKEGICVAVVPHTTAGICINENADPDVVTDMLYALEKAVPWQAPQYRHGEGNSAAHLKASLVGQSVLVLVEQGCLQFGRWQGIYLCEFDGPRTRQVWVRTLGQ